MTTEPGRRSARSPSFARALAFAVAALLAAASGAPAADGSLDLAFRADAGGGGIFTVRGRLDAPRGALVLVGLSFDGQVVHGSWRRVELGPDGVLVMTWPTRARVLPGEYEAVATIDSGRQPRTLRPAVPGPARSLRATAYVGEPEADVAEEETARRSLLADVSTISSLSRECVEAAPITTASNARAKAARRAFLTKTDALLDQLDRRLAGELPPIVFASRLPDLEETLAQTVKSFRQAVRVEAWHDVDLGLEPPEFLDRTQRPQPPFVTLKEVAVEAARVQAELESSRAGRARGPRALEKLLRQSQALARELERGDASAPDEERRARRARRVRAETLARELALDPVASGIAGGSDELKRVAQGLEELTAAADGKRAAAHRALVTRLSAIESRVSQERTRRRLEIDELAHSLEKLEQEIRRLKRDERDGWRRSVDEVRGSIAALPERNGEFFPGVRNQLDLAARALLAREAADGLRALYLESVVRDALAKVRSSLPPA